MVDTAESLGLPGAALEMMIYSKADESCPTIGNRAFYVTQGHEILKVSTNKSSSVCRKMCKSVMKRHNNTGKRHQQGGWEIPPHLEVRIQLWSPKVGLPGNSGQKEKGGNLPKYRLITATGKDQRNVIYTGIIVVSWTSHCQDDGSSSVVYRLFTCRGWWTEPQLGRGSPSLEWR